MRVDYGGQIHEFPDDFSEAEIASALSSVPDPEYEAELAKVTKESAGPRVPFSGVNEGLTPAQEARQNITQRRKDKAAEKAFEATRTPGRRVLDTANFAASVPVRAVSRGEYGIGDVFGLLSRNAGESAKQSEQSFAEANPTGMFALGAAGEVGAGIPGLSTMGAGPAAMVRQMGPKAYLNRLAVGAVGGDLPPRGAPAGPRTLYSNPLAPPPNTAGAIPAAPPTPTGPGTRIPARENYTATSEEAIAAGNRIGVPLPRGVVGNRIEQGAAGAIEGMPYANEPILGAYEGTLRALGNVADEATGRLGAPGAQGAGSAVKTRLSNWMKDATALDDTKISDLYSAIDREIKPGVPVNLTNTRNLYNRLTRLRDKSTTGAYDAAIRELEPMLDQKKFPKGMDYASLKEKRTSIIAKQSGDIVPEAGTSQPALEMIRKALTKDMEFALQRAGGKRAVAMWKEANAAASNVASKREIFSDLIGKDAGKAPEKVVSRFREMGGRQAGSANMSAARAVWRHLGEEERGNVAATVMEQLGRGVKTDDWSAGRFLTDYGKMSEAFKRMVLGEAKAHYDDIARVASRVQKFEGRINYSRSAGNFAFLKVIMNPVTLVSGAAGAVMNPVAGMGMAATAGGALAGLRTARSMAWYLAKPAVAKESSKLFRAYVRASSRGTRAAEVIAKNEEALKAATASYSQTLAKESGGDAADIQAKIEAQIKNLRSE